MSIPIGKYMHAEHLGCEPHDLYMIHARDGSSIGYTEWYPRWNEYVFRPDDGIVLSHDCCLAMGQFLESCNKATGCLGGCAQ